MRTQTSSHHDVVVVGARCAGSATAMLLARAGHDVVVVDRATFPSDVLSTHSIARGGVVQLARWGLLDSVVADGAPPVREVTFGSAGTVTTRQVRERAGVDFVLAPRRDRLDTLLTEAARGAGADVRTGVTARAVRRDDGGRVTGLQAISSEREPMELTARYVVGADGLRSWSARAFGARVVESFTADTATAYLYAEGVPWRGNEYHVAEDAFAGVFVTHGGQAVVWLVRPTPRLRTLRAPATSRVEALLAEVADVAPDLGRRLALGRPTSRVRATAGLPNHLREASGPGWALVGDAGYHRDPITGHGITDAFRDAELLAGALHRALSDRTDERHALAGYRRARDTALRETFELTKALALFPEPTRFVALQKELSEALEREAEALAAYPPPVQATAPAA